MLTILAKGAAIAGFVVVVLFVGYVLWQALFPPTPKPSDQSNARQIQSQEQQRSDEIAAPVAPNDSADEKIATYTLALAVFTAFLVLIAVFQVVYLIRAEGIAISTAQAAKDSADAAKQAAVVAERAMIAGQRAWIRPKNDIGTLVFDANGLSSSVGFVLTNVGTTPAINVTMHAWLVAMKPHGPMPRDELNRHCDEIRAQTIWQNSGTTLFPNELLPVSWTPR